MSHRRRRPLPSDQEEYSQQDQPSPEDRSPYYPQARTRSPTQTRPSRRRNPISYAQQEHSHSSDQEQSASQPQQQRFLAPQVECLLWRQNNPLRQQDRFLVKFRNRSHHHCQWLDREQLSAIDYDITATRLKSVSTRMSKTRELKLPSGYFNPNFLQADRILTSTDLFAAIHHKRANDIKGNWEESLLLVCQKLLNLVREDFPYGVVLQEPHKHPQMARCPNNSVPEILNRIYLGCYKRASDFWKELGAAFTHYLEYYGPESQDYYKVGVVLRECSAFLYQQWHALSMQRYRAVCATVQQNALFDPKIHQEEEHQGYGIPEKYVKTNIFLGEKSVDLPTSQLELDPLWPCSFTLEWLGPAWTSLKTFSFEHLTEADMDRLNLNTEVETMYYVKWGDLGYGESTWESERNIPASKIEEFKRWNKIPVRESREKAEHHRRWHHQLLQWQQMLCQKRNAQPNESMLNLQSQLYLTTASTRKGKPIEYGGKDVPIFKNYRQLKDFQIESLNWLVSNWHENRNCILADEMGLGKTVQTIAFLHHLKEREGLLGPFLVLSPLTTLIQWRREVEDWTNFNCLLYYDGQSSSRRDAIQEYEFYHMHTSKSGEVVPSEIPKFQVLLTSYETFMIDFDVLKRIPFQHVVLDEAHRLKNSSSKLTSSLRKLPCTRKTLLTGTPIQNNTKELWTLLNFIAPDHFQSDTHFMQTFGSLSTDEQVRAFKRLLKPYLLRRVKEEVETTIPRLSEIIIDVEMTSCQKTYYRGILEKNKTTVLRSLASANFNSIAIQLRKCCNHPYLISPDIEHEVLDSQRDSGKIDRLEGFVRASGKTVLLMKLLAKFKREGKKALVFSQFVLMLDLMKPYLQTAGYNCEILKGSQNATSRHQAISRFSHAEPDVFLISTKAGGVGINLIAATEIVIFDSDWNPQNDLQATARAHRIGQKREVSVYRLITAHSYESEMFELSSKKLGLEKAVFAGGGFKAGEEEERGLGKDEVEMLLKKGIVGFLATQTEGDEFFNKSIEDILEKNARKVQYALTQNSCTFSKTKFRSEDQNDIRVDAPDFWQQALKGVETPIEKLTKRCSQLRSLTSHADQQSLMLDTYRTVIEFVREKTNGTNFNADDEIKLLGFLNEINEERIFQRHYRDIAAQLCLEIEKPSRRFKVTEEQIRNKANAPTRQQHTRLRRQDNVEANDDSSVEDSVEDGSQEMLKAIEEEPEEIEKFVEKVRSEELFDSNKEAKKSEEEQGNREFKMEENRSNEADRISEKVNEQAHLQPASSLKIQSLPQIPRSDSLILRQEDQEDEDNQSVDPDDIPALSQPSLRTPSNSRSRVKAAEQVSLDADKLCAVCVRPNCSIFCSDTCGRSFHAECYAEISKQSLDNSAKKSQRIDQIEEESKQIIRCFGCRRQEYNFKCSVCLQDGLYVKQAREGDARLTQQAESRRLYQCSLGDKCHRFYHLSCLFSPKFMGKFADKLGRTLRTLVPTRYFRCPSHYCHSCYGVDAKSNKSRSTACIRCCISFHEKCQPQGHFAKIAGTRQYVCNSHSLTEPTLKEHIEEENQNRKSKREKMAVKKEAKIESEEKVQAGMEEENGSRKEVSVKREEQETPKHEREKRVIKPTQRHMEIEFVRKNMEKKPISEKIERNVKREAKIEKEEEGLRRSKRIKKDEAEEVPLIMFGKKAIEEESEPTNFPKKDQGKDKSSIRKPPINPFLQQLL